MNGTSQERCCESYNTIGGWCELTYGHGGDHEHGGIRWPYRKASELPDLPPQPNLHGRVVGITAPGEDSLAVGRQAFLDSASQRLLAARVARGPRGPDESREEMVAAMYHLAELLWAERERRRHA